MCSQFFQSCCAAVGIVDGLFIDVYDVEDGL